MRYMRFATVAALAVTAPALADDLQIPRMTLAYVLTLDDLPKAPATGTAATAPEQLSSPSAAEPAGMTGDWGGMRNWLSDKHLFVGGSLLVDGAKNLRGGLDTAAWPVSYLLDLHLTADLEGMAGWSGGTAYADFQSHDQSGNSDRIVGDAQGYDDMASPRFVQVAQLWFRQDFSNTLSLKIGKIDANADAAKPGADAHDAFSLIEHSSDFLNNGASSSPAIFVMPSYPTAAPGIEAFIGDSVYAGGGAFYSNTHDTFLNISGSPQSTLIAAGGMFFIGEAGGRWSLGNLAGHAGAGAWFHNGVFPRNDGNGTTRGTGGGYAFVDQTLYHDEGEGRPTRDLGAFLTAGLADKTTSPMDRSLAAGIAASGFMPGRPDDSMGALCSWVRIPPQPGLLHPFEMAAEVYYKIHLTPWASLQPDFQYIVNPSGKHPDAAVVTVRAEIDF